MKVSVTKSIMHALFIAGLSLGVAACSDNDAEEAGEQIDQMVDDAGDAMEDAGDSISDAATDAGNAIEDACEDVKDSVDAEDKDC